MRNDEFQKEIYKLRQHLNSASEWADRLDIDRHKDAAIHHLIRIHEGAERLIRDYEPERFGIRQSTCIHTPELNLHRLHVCDICGQPYCQSDHK